MASCLLPFHSSANHSLTSLVEGFPPFVRLERNIRPGRAPGSLCNFSKPCRGLMAVSSVLFVRIFGSYNGLESSDMSTVSYYLLEPLVSFCIMRLYSFNLGNSSHHLSDMIFGTAYSFVPLSKLEPWPVKLPLSSLSILFCTILSWSIISKKKMKIR